MSSRTPTTITVVEEREQGPVVLEEAQHPGPTPAKAIRNLRERFETAERSDRWLEVDNA